MDYKRAGIDCSEPNRFVYFLETSRTEIIKV